MIQFILMFQVLISVGLIVLVLLQQGKGAQMGAAFGSGASQTLFGSQGSSSFLLKLTALFAALFFATSILLGYLASIQVKQDPLQALTSSVAQQQKVSQQKNTIPIAPNAGVPVPANNVLPPSSGSTTPAK